MASLAIRSCFVLNARTASARGDKFYSLSPRTDLKFECSNHRRRTDVLIRRPARNPNKFKETTDYELND